MRIAIVKSGDELLACIASKVAVLKNSGWVPNDEEPNPSALKLLAAVEGQTNIRKGDLMTPIQRTEV
jgi:hypothetical protein